MRVTSTNKKKKNVLYLIHFVEPRTKIMESACLVGVDMNFKSGNVSCYLKQRLSKSQTVRKERNNLELLCAVNAMKDLN